VTGSKYCLSVDPNIGAIIAHDSCPMAQHLKLRDCMKPITVGNGLAAEAGLPPARDSPAITERDAARFVD